MAGDTGLLTGTYKETGLMCQQPLRWQVQLSLFFFICLFVTLLEPSRKLYVILVFYHPW